MTWGSATKCMGERGLQSAIKWRKCDFSVRIHFALLSGDLTVVMNWPVCVMQPMFDRTRSELIYTPFKALHFLLLLHFERSHIVFTRRIWITREASAFSEHSKDTDVPDRLATRTGSSILQTKSSLSYSWSYCMLVNSQETGRCSLYRGVVLLLTDVPAPACRRSLRCPKFDSARCW
jgi:hypothetical protein